MKRVGITVAVVALLGLLVFSVTGCTAPQKEFVDNVHGTWGLIGPKFREYVDQDSEMEAPEKDDWKKLSDSFDRLIRAAQKAVKEDD